MRGARTGRIVEAHPDSRRACRQSLYWKATNSSFQSHGNFEGSRTDNRTLGRSRRVARYDAADLRDLQHACANLRYHVTAMATIAAKKRERRGKLKIGDDWNAITIIALSQSNPLKAIAELVENCIDAKASSVTITRGREHGRHLLAIRDDGEGVARDADGRPDFHYVATHICDSIKRRLKESTGTPARVSDDHAERGSGLYGQSKTCAFWRRWNGGPDCPTAGGHSFFIR
jgi:hypothetical protein